MTRTEALRLLVEADAIHDLRVDLDILLDDTILPDIGFDIIHNQLKATARLMSGAEVGVAEKFGITASEYHSKMLLVNSHKIRGIAIAEAVVAGWRDLLDKLPGENE